MPTNPLTHLGEKFESVILNTTGASAMRVESVIQELWSGYGQILRIALTNGDREHIVAKHIVMPQGSRHPRMEFKFFSREKSLLLQGRDRVVSIVEHAL